MCRVNCTRISRRQLWLPDSHFGICWQTFTAALRTGGSHFLFQDSCNQIILLYFSYIVINNISINININIIINNISAAMSVLLTDDVWVTSDLRLLLARIRTFLHLVKSKSKSCLVITIMTNRSWPSCSLLLMKMQIFYNVIPDGYIHQKLKCLGYASRFIWL